MLIYVGAVCVCVKGLSSARLAAFMATDPLHVILGNIIDIYMKNTCAKAHKDASRDRL